jgi:hypothetical protein
VVFIDGINRIISPTGISTSMPEYWSITEPDYIAKSCDIGDANLIIHHAGYKKLFDELSLSTEDRIVWHSGDNPEVDNLPCPVREFHHDQPIWNLFDQMFSKIRKSDDVRIEWRKIYSLINNYRSIFEKRISIILDAFYVRILLGERLDPAIVQKQRDAIRSILRHPQFLEVEPEYNRISEMYIDLDKRLNHDFEKGQMIEELSHLRDTVFGNEDDTVPGFVELL